jgi:hypothetical protein
MQKPSPRKVVALKSGRKAPLATRTDLGRDAARDIAGAM